MNLTFLLQLTNLFLPYYFFDSNEKYFPIEMIDMLHTPPLYGSFYYENTLLSQDITSYDELLKYVIVDDNRYVSSNLSYTNNQTLFAIQGNEQFIFEGSNSKKNPIYVEYIYSKTELYIIYTTLYMFNGEIHCGFLIPCGFHEGDIEHVIVKINLQTKEPDKVFFSAHRDGYWFPWHTIHSHGTHPLIYVASMTHANYPTKGLLLRCFGLLSDQTDGKIFWKPQKKIILHANFHPHSIEYLYNGYLGNIASFANKRQTYLKQIKESDTRVFHNMVSMLSDMFFTMD